MNVELKITKSVTVSDFSIKNNIQNSEVTTKVSYSDDVIVMMENGIVKMDGEVIGAFVVSEDGNLSIHNTTFESVSVVANLVNEAIAKIKDELKTSN